MNMKHRDYYWIILLIGCILIIILPGILTLHWRDEFLEFNTNFTNTGQIGDTIGGITAPIIGLISIILLYKTLKEQQKFNRWTSSEDTLHRIEKILSTCITIKIHKIDGQGINGKITKTSIAELSILLIENKLELTISEGRLLRSYLKKIILNINKYLKLDPQISTDLNTDIIKSYISSLLPIYNAIEKGYITFQLEINNIDYDKGDEDNEYNKGDEDILVQSFKEDKKLYNNLPPEYLPEQAKQ